MSDRVAVMNAGRIEQIGAACRHLRAAGVPLRRRIHWPDEPFSRPDCSEGGRLVVRTALAPMLGLPRAARRSRGGGREHRHPPRARPRLLDAPPGNCFAAQGRVDRTLYLGATREIRLNLEGGARATVEAPMLAQTQDFDPATRSGSPPHSRLPRAQFRNTPLTFMCPPPGISFRGDGARRPEHRRRPSPAPRLRASCGASAGDASHRRKAWRSAARSGCPTTARRRPANGGGRRTPAGRANSCRYWISSAPSFSAMPSISQAQRPM